MGQVSTCPNPQHSSDSAISSKFSVMRSRANSMWCPAGSPLWLTRSRVCHIQAFIRENRHQNVPQSPEESGHLIAKGSSGALNLRIKMAGDGPLKISSLWEENYNQGTSAKLEEKMFHSKLLRCPQHMEDINTEVPERCHLLTRKER